MDAAKGKDELERKGVGGEGAGGRAVSGASCATAIPAVPVPVGAAPSCRRVEVEEEKTRWHLSCDNYLYTLQHWRTSPSALLRPSMGHFEFHH